MKQQNRFNQSFIPGEVYLFHCTDPECPACGSLYGIFDKETSDAIYLESSSSDLQTFRHWHRLTDDYRYCRLAARSELRDYIFNLACDECLQPTATGNHSAGPDTRGDRISIG